MDTIQHPPPLPFLAVNATLACRIAVTIDASTNLPDYPPSPSPSLPRTYQTTHPDFAFPIVRENGIMADKLLYYWTRVIKQFLSLQNSFLNGKEKKTEKERMIYLSKRGQSSYQGFLLADLNGKEKKGSRRRRR